MIEMAERVAVPTVFQNSPSESGACALSMILAHYELRLPLHKLLNACGAQLSAANPAPLLKAAQSFGLEGSVRRLDSDATLQLPMPMIVLLDHNIFAVLEGSEDGNVYLNLPSDGLQQVNASEFKQRFTGTLITLKPGAKFTSNGQQSSLPVMIARRLKGGGGSFLAMLLTSLLLLLPSLAMPVFTQQFIDMVLLKNLNSWLFPIITGLLIAALLSIIGTAVQQYSMRRLESQIAIDASAHIFWRCLTAPVLFFSNTSVGNAASTLTRATRVADLLSNSLGTNFSNLMTATLYLTVLMIYSAKLGLIIVVLSSLNVGVVRLVNRKRGEINKKQIVQVAQTYSVAINGFRAIESLKANCMEGFFFRKQADLSAKNIANQQQVDSLSLMLNMVPQVLTAVNSAIVLTLGSFFVISSDLTIGELFAIQMFSTRFCKPIQDLMAGTQSIVELHTGLTSCETIINAPVDIVTAPRPTSSMTERLSGHIELRNVSFGFSPDSPPVITDLSLTIAPGSRVAITGASGSGKSTLAKIALGLYELRGGVVLYDGRAIEQIPRPVWASSIGYVSQDISLFEGSVRDNITLWDESIPIEDVRQAAKDAEIDDIIATRPGGYDSMVAEGGSNFSGGESQRIEISRALVRNPRILLLDEATSALDSETEVRVDHNLRRRGCTCLIVAHRLSTLKDADEIIVLDQGKVIERGTHEELVSNNGHYAQLIKLA